MHAHMRLRRLPRRGTPDALSTTHVRHTSPLVHSQCPSTEAQNTSPTLGLCRARKRSSARNEPTSRSMRKLWKQTSVVTCPFLWCAELNTAWPAGLAPKSGAVQHSAVTAAPYRDSGGACCTGTTALAHGGMLVSLVATVTSSFMKNQQKFTQQIGTVQRHLFLFWRPGTSNRMFWHNTAAFLLR